MTKYEQYVLLHGYSFLHFGMIHLILCRQKKIDA